MKSLLKELFFDRELITGIRKTNVTAEQLYNQLTNGKITLKEYLRLV